MMAAIIIRQRLAFVSVTVRAKGQELQIDQVLLDTGSAGTAFDTDVMRSVGIKPELSDKPARLLGIGGIEFAVRKRVEAVEVGELVVSPMIVQLAGLNYGYDVKGIIGLDFLLRTGAVIDFKAM